MITLELVINLEKNPTKQAKPGVNSAAIVMLVKQLESGGRIILSKTPSLKTNDIILEASRKLKGNKFVVCHANLKGAKNSRQFLKRLKTAYYLGFFPKRSDLEKYKSSQLEKMIQAFEKLKDSSPLFVKPNQKAFDFSEKDWSASIDLAEQFAKRFRKKTVVFLENFDVLCTFKDSLKLQERLRACMQHHSRVSYCFTVGSLEREIEIFHSYKAPFYLTASRLTTMN
jgi:hypothetical protein